MPIRKILIANRGEIAVRIIRAARELGLATAQVFSQADREMLAVKLADEAVEIGPPGAAKSYLDMAAILRAAALVGADAIHPGYGFLSENADFAASVENAGLIFIGPSAATVRQMGDKARARQVAAAAGVPVVPGSLGRLFLFTKEAFPFASCYLEPLKRRRGGDPSMETRYSFGGDEHLFSEIDEEMSLAAFFKSFAMTKAVRASGIKGVTEICPANASFLVRFDPDMIAPDDLLAELKALEAQADKAEARLKTRIIEIPVFYNDPWTRETLMRFRERHQDPASTDLEYGARSNGYDSIDAFIAAHAGAPWFVPIIGFVAGVPWLYQMVE